MPNLTIREQPVRFDRTRDAATNDKQSKWDLIEAIAIDATDNELAITGGASQLAAKIAFEDAGVEYEDTTIRHLCMVAKFDWESTPKQRDVWRGYGWTIVRSLALAGWSQSAVAHLLSGKHKTRTQVQEAIRETSGSVPGNTKPLDDRWREWVNRASHLLVDGAKLASESEHADLGAHSEMGLLIYRRMAERHIDAEMRGFLDSLGSR